MNTRIFIELDWLHYYNKEENEFFFFDHEVEVGIKPVIKTKHTSTEDFYSLSTEWLPNIEQDVTRIETFDRTCFYVKNKLEDIVEALSGSGAEMGTFKFLKPSKSI